MAAYPPDFDNPCICDRCGQDVEGMPGVHARKQPPGPG